MKHPFFVYFGCKGNENILQREKKMRKFAIKKGCSIVFEQPPSPHLSG